MNSNVSSVLNQYIESKRKDRADKPIPELPYKKPSEELLPIREENQPASQNMLNTDYLNALLINFLGEKVHVEFLIGSNNTEDRTGVLLDVGANYIVLNESETNTLLICDFYSIKFVRVYI